MAVHLFHQPAQLPELLKIAEEHGLVMIEDSAESIGMWCDGRHTGLAGDAGVLSFFPTKTLGCLGDGGMVITKDDDTAEICRQLRDHGRQSGETGLVSRPGHSSRLDSIQAAVLLARMQVLDQEIERRAQLADLYSERLATLSPVVRVPRFVPRQYQCNGVWYVYVIECERRDDLAAFLAARGIFTETYYPLPLHLQPAFASWGHRIGDFPVAERVCSRTLALPLYPDLEEPQVDLVCEAIAEFYRG
jgi:dTDP-4-amino-4,6-dideoxygalactose transaminase